MRELRCRGCARLLGFTSRTQAVPAQCTDPFCAAQPPTSDNEERDSFMQHLWSVEKMSDSAISELFGLTRQRVNYILVNR
jgi:hypothetical protein